jgi:hypothetical protein
MANQPDKPQDPVLEYVFVGKALKVPPGVRIRPKKLARYDDPVIPRSYWFLTAGLAAVAVVLGLLAGRFLLN